MIESLTAWVGRIVLLLVAAAVVDLALPSGTMRRYVEVVLGLVVLVTVLTPLLGWLGADLSAAVASARVRLDRELAVTADLSGAHAVQAAAGVGAARHEAALRGAYADRIAQAVAQGLAHGLGVTARVDLTLGTGPAGSPPPIEQAVIRVVGGAADAGTATPPASARSGGTSSEPVRIAPIRVGSPPGGSVEEPAAPGSPGGGGDGGPAPVDSGLAAEIRRWVAAALAVDPGRVEVRAGEEVQR